MPQPRNLCALLVLAAVAAWTGVSSATTWDVEATVSDERKTEVTDEGSDRTETFEQSYSITYETEINPVLLLAIDFALDITDEINEGPDPDTDFDTREIKPSIDVELQAVWWDLTGSWEETQKSSDDPDQADTKDFSWNVEYTAEPASEVLPALKLKFQRDETIEDGQTQNRDDDIEGSLDYTFWDLLDLTFDAKKETLRDIGAIVVTDINDPDNTLAEIDQTQEDRSYKVDISLDKELWDTIKLEAEWTNERQQTVEYADDTYLDIVNGPPIIGDEITARDDTLKNTLKGKVTYTLLEDLEFSLEREIDWDKDLEVGPLEVTDTWTGSAAYGASLTETIDLDLSYDDERKDTRGTGSDSYAITRDYAAALDFSPLENITLSPSFDRSDKVEWFDDPEKPKDDSVDDKWEVQLDASVWKDQVELSLTRTFNTTTESGKKTTDERNWDADLTFTFDGVPNLEFSPQYTYTEDRDLLANTTDLERKVEVGIVYELTLGEVTTFTIDHTYSRTSKDPAEGVGTIQRDDDSDVTLSFDNFLKGMGLELSLTRKATDESEDDKGPEIDYTYNVTYDYEFLENYTFSFEYKLDKKQESEDVRNFQTTLSMDFLDGLLTVDLEHEFEEQLEGDTKDTHRYLIEITGKF